MLALAAAILAFAGPVLNPRARRPGSGPLLVLLDGGWADAPDWAAARWTAPRAALAEAGRGRAAGGAGRADRPPPGGPVLPGAAADWRPSGCRASRRAPGRRTGPPGPPGSRLPDGAFETLWLSDGIGATAARRSWRRRCSAQGR